MVADQRRARTARALTGGGTDGNERLTAATGVVLIVLLVVVGATIVWIGRLLDVHMFVGMLLIGPVALKLASTGYRFARYYMHEPRYVGKGPPLIGLRLIAPMVVLTTVVVFVSGVVLLLAGRSAHGTWFPIHKIGFIVWAALMAAHVLGHLLDLPRALRTRDAVLAGGAGRGVALAVALGGGLVLAIASISLFGAWTHGRG